MTTPPRANSVRERLDAAVAEVRVTRELNRITARRVEQPWWRRARWLGSRVVCILLFRDHWWGSPRYDSEWPKSLGRYRQCRVCGTRLIMRKGER